MFINSLILSTFITISSNSWMGMWIGLEINLLSIIPLMNNIKNSYSSESSIKYFIVQAISSAIMLMSVILTIKFNTSIPLSNINNSISMIFNSSMMTKMGAAPFHFWFPEIMEGLNWFNCFIMMTWQKISPFILLNYSINNINFIILVIICSTLIGGIMGLNQTSLRKIFTYSSINHISWMISSIMFIETIWFYYLIIYSFILMNLIIVLNTFKIFYLKQIFMFTSKNLLIYYFFILNLFSLGGLPPFIGFFPKWIIIQSMINENFIFLSYFMIIFTLLTLFYYIRIMFSSLTLNINEINFIKINSHSLFLPNLINTFNLISLPVFTICFNFI
uniref:NADH-ubiquinone oxidoreductase chain 2 n=1 Tax=Brachygluta helferi TaxID=351497 RepID=A0A0S2M6T5_9COLE|nr:NADH deshydrogenase subunit 2 [Brachygluta helferi]